jgi:CubicO group peptidase (beta-lactamase class C family)
VSATLLARRPGRCALAIGLLTLALSASACGTHSANEPAALPTSPPTQVTALFTRAQVDTALHRLDGLVQDAQRRTGVPGVAVAVVYQDEVAYLKGFGVREAGKPDTVDPDTVFQLASVSKPLASTVLAGLVGRKTIGWDDPVRTHRPGFALRDPYVTANATFADLLSHRSGLHTGAGDLLEDLGFDRDYILAHLDQQPLDPFRSSYNYSNFGYTEAGVAAADAAHMSWADLASDVLFTPLGMNQTSYRYADYLAAPNRAVPHVPVGHNVWAARYQRDADAEAPAGGASSTARDLAQWLRLQLAGGRLDGAQLIDADALATTHVPQVISGPPATPDGRAHFYGLGWNVSYDDQARLQLNHSGAFNLGAATVVSMLPSEQLGIVVLTNGRPMGIPEAIAAGFFDVARNGRPTVDWLSFTGERFRCSSSPSGPRLTTPHARPRPPRLGHRPPISAATPTPTTGHW